MDLHGEKNVTNKKKTQIRLVGLNFNTISEIQPSIHQSTLW